MHRLQFTVCGYETVTFGHKAINALAFEEEEEDEEEGGGGGGREDEEEEGGGGREEEEEEEEEEEGKGPNLGIADSGRSPEHKCMLRREDVDAGYIDLVLARAK